MKDILSNQLRYYNRGPVKTIPSIGVPIVGSTHRQDTHDAHENRRKCPISSKVSGVRIAKGSPIKKLFLELSTRNVGSFFTLNTTPQKQVDFFFNISSYLCIHIFSIEDYYHNPSTNKYINNQE